MAEYKPEPQNEQAERRFYRSVKLHGASARVIERLALQHGISVTHAAVITDLAGIGGKWK